MPTASNSWGSVAQSLVIIGAQGVGVPAPAAAVTVIRALLGIEDTQAALLNQIGSDVHLIRTGPFRSAQEHLDAARRKASAGKKYARHLREAENLLIEALGRSASLQEKSIINFNLGVIAAILNDQSEALYRLQTSYENCRAAIKELRSQVKIWYFSPKRAALAGPLILFSGPAGWTGAAVGGIREHNKNKKGYLALAALREYAPFVNGVARAYNVIAPAPMLAGVQVNPDLGRHSTYLLKWTTPET
jgi:hypothetical protein